MDEWTTSDGRVDVAEVMSRIREKIRGRRDLGLYTDEEVEELTALKLQAFADDAGIDPELLARLMARQPQLEHLDRLPDRDPPAGPRRAPRGRSSRSSCARGCGSTPTTR